MQTPSKNAPTQGLRTAHNQPQSTAAAQAGEPHRANRARAHVPLLSSYWDELTEEERIGILRAFFARAESLQPSMMK